MSNDLEDVKHKICSYCAYQERSLQEVGAKLNEFELSDSEKNDLTDYLCEEGYVDDRRFAFTYAGSKFRQKKWGKRKIWINLKQKGIDDHLCEAALNEITDSEYFSAMLDLLQKKANSLDEPDIYKFKLKLYNFVKGKGYENELIWKGISEIDC